MIIMVSQYFSRYRYRLERGAAIGNQVFTQGRCIRVTVWITLQWGKKHILTYLVSFNVHVPRLNLILKLWKWLMSLGEDASFVKDSLLV